MVRGPAVMTVAALTSPFSSKTCVIRPLVPSMNFIVEKNIPATAGLIGSTIGPAPILFFGVNPKIGAGRGLSFVVREIANVEGVGAVYANFENAQPLRREDRG